MLGQRVAFATGILPDIYASHRYTRNSTLLSRTQVVQFQRQTIRLSRWISPLTCTTAYTPFTPSDSEQRLLPPYYRGCWHGASRSFLLRYRQIIELLTRKCFFPHDRALRLKEPSSPTRRRSVRVSPIAEASRLLPPVGVWAVSQSQCGRTPSQAGYPSLPW